jgi:FkbM family methyltransferase
MAKVQYTEGPLAGYVFECFTSERYFIMGSRFEYPLQTLVGKHVKAGDIIYDIGAHIGYWSLLFSALCESDGHTYAFEPLTINLNRLQRNLALNKLEGFVTAVDAAASSHEGTAVLAGSGSQGHIIAEGATTSKEEELTRVRTIRLDDFVYLDHHRAPTFVKVDVEGHAGPCLMGMRRVLSEWCPPVLCELHDTQEESEVHAVLRDCGYQIVDVKQWRFHVGQILALPPKVFSS